MGLEPDQDSCADDGEALSSSSSSSWAAAAASRLEVKYLDEDLDLVALSHQADLDIALSRPPAGGGGAHPSQSYKQLTLYVDVLQQ